MSSTLSTCASTAPKGAAAVFRSGLGQGSAGEPIDAPLTDRDWGALQDWAAVHRLETLLSHATSHGFAATAAQTEMAKAASRDRLVVALQADQTLMSCLPVLERLGVDHRVLKGVATSRLVHDGQVRSPGDLDLLVPFNDFAAVADSLVRAGFRRLPSGAFGPRSEHVKKGFDFTAPSGGQLDLHRRVDVRLGPYEIPERVMFAGATPFSVGGLQATAPSFEAMFLHAALHLAAPNTGLSTLLDLGSMIAGAQVDALRVRSAAEAVGLHGVLAWAMGRLGGWMDLPADFAALTHAGFYTGKAARVLIEHPKLGEASYLWHRGRGVGRLKLLLEPLWPSDEFLALKGRTHWQHLSRLDR